jgi:hypothetical protein
MQSRMNELKQKFPRIEQCVRQAEQACHSDSSVPQDLKQCISELDRQCVEAKQMLQQGRDESGVVSRVDTMEQLGDRAKQACENSTNLQPQTRSAIVQVHDEISRLKHQLH